MGQMTEMSQQKKQISGSIICKLTLHFGLHLCRLNRDYTSFPHVSRAWLCHNVTKDTKQFCSKWNHLYVSAVNIHFPVLFP